MSYTTRHINLLSALKNNHLDGFIVTKKENIQYLTGISTPHPNHREAILLLTPSKAILYHSSFYQPSLPKHIEAIPMSKSNPQQIVFRNTFSNLTDIAIEAYDLTVSELDKYQQILPEVTFKKHHDLVENLRLTKDKQEIKLMKLSANITSSCMDWIITHTKANAGHITEKEILNLINHVLLTLGADDIAFPTIVATDANSALPHHQPNDTPITKNSVVLIDFGCKVSGYCSDMTRTIYIGTPPLQFKKVEQTVKAAYQAALNIISPSLDKEGVRGSLTKVTLPLTKRERPSDSIAEGVKTIRAKDLDQAARSVITKAGFSKYFTHTTGHGLGLEIHEQPSLNSKNDQPIVPNMTFTIEPGIYLPGKFGYRHENTMLATKNSLQPLT